MPDYRHLALQGYELALSWRDIGIARYKALSPRMKYAVWIVVALHIVVGVGFLLIGPERVFQ